MKAVVILSGGMDSTTLLYDLVKKKYEVHALSFNYEQKHSRELRMAEKTCQKLGVNHKIVNLQVLNEVAPSALTRKDWEVPEGHYEEESMKQTVVPNRNMVMISLAVSYAIGIGAKRVYYGAHAGDHEIYPDCRKEFVEQLAKTIELCDLNKIELWAPYLELNKADIVSLGTVLKVDYSMTQTCYKGKERACGRCGSCTERLEAFAKNKREDPIEYGIL